MTSSGISSVTDLNITFKNTLLIAWSPPTYYSDDIPINSRLSYQVLVADEEQTIENATTNTFIEMINITECDTFNVSVRAQIAQYTSIDSKMNHIGCK